MKVDRHVRQWLQEGVVDAATAARIVEFEATHRSRLGVGAMLIGLAGFAILLGVAALIGVNWDQIPAAAKIGFHTLVNAAVGLVLFRFVRTGREKTIWFDLLIGLLVGLTLTFIALVGQIYQTQEPLWKALAFWLAITTPFWLCLAARRVLVRLWVLSAVAVYCLFLSDAIPVEAEQTRMLLVTLPAFAMIALGQNSFLRPRHDVTLGEISGAGFLIVALLVSLAQVAWSYDVFHEFDLDLVRPLVWRTLGATAAAVVGIIVLRRLGLLVARAPAVDIFLVTSVVVGAVSFLVPSPESPAVGAAIIMGYWALCGWAGAAAGHHAALWVSATLIALRLIGAYVELFGSLLMTGTGLIVSGVLLLLLVWGTRHALTVVARLRGETRS